MGLGLVFLTLSLFFAWRFSFWVAMGLPVSFAGTLFAMGILGLRSEEHTSELQSHSFISSAVSCLKKKNTYIVQ